MISRRIIVRSLASATALGLAGCAPGGGTRFSPSQAGGSNGEQAEEDIVLKPDGNPKVTDLMKPGPLGDKGLGRVGAPVTIIKYASLTCPYCRAFQQKTYGELKRRYIDTGEVRYILREFPIGHASGAATIAMRCLGQDDDKLYFQLYDKFINKQHLWVSQEIRKNAIFKVAAETGITRKKFDSCFENQNIVEGLKWVKQRGRKLGVTGTPTFFINGKKVRAVLTIDQMRNMIEPYLT